MFLLLDAHTSCHFHQSREPGTCQYQKTKPRRIQARLVFSCIRNCGGREESTISAIYEIMLSLLTLLQLVIFIRSPDLVLSRRIQDSLQSAPERLLQGNACDTNAKRDCRNECFEDKKCVTDVCKVVSTNDGTANDTDSVRPK